MWASAKAIRPRCIPARLELRRREARILQQLLEPVARAAQVGEREVLAQLAQLEALRLELLEGEVRGRKLLDREDLRGA